jgi:5-methylcytosine-specific restriction endonuclease McrA
MSSEQCSLNLMARDPEAYNAYMAAYMKRWYDRRHAEATAALGGHCARCPATEDLQFDHIDPAAKTMTIAKMWTASEARFQAELAKCQLLCRPHHLEKTLAERGQTAARGTHGTLSAYRYCGPPKCSSCRAVKRAYANSRR